MRKVFPLIAVFITGAAVLVVEVAATRILAPYYGNTIYTFSSVIGVILAALSCGYYLGGRLADRRPSGALFFSIIAAGGLSVLFLQLLNTVLLPRVAMSMSIMIGPLLLSVLLFALPAALLGMLSPFAIKLLQTAESKTGVGTLAGRVFFWSTLGSIVGSLLAGFVLVPHLGVSRIMVGTGAVLVLLGSAGLIQARAAATAGALLVPGIVLMLSTVALESDANAPGVLLNRDGIYEHMTVFDTMLQNRPARVLKQDRAVSGILYLDNGEITDYLNYAAIAPMVKADIRSALVIGGGAYLLPRYLLQAMPQANVDVAEIEPGLINIAQKYFQLPANDPRLANHVMDGRRFLHDTETKYDLIFSDVFFALTVPPHIATQEFFQLAKSRLSENGVFMANFVGDFLPESPSILLTEIKTMQSVFKNSYLFAVDAPGSMEVQGVIALGINGDAKLDVNSDAVKAHSNPLVRELAMHLVDQSKLHLARQPTLTDDYCPTEYIAFRTHRRELAN